MPSDQEKRIKVKELIQEVNSLIFNQSNIDVEKIKETEMISLIETILENPNLAEDE